MTITAMEMEITKEDFESIVTVAASAQTHVYEKVQPYIGMQTDMFLSQVMGGLSTADDEITAKAKAYVCLDAFLHVFRQLDLVLTPTGFGVVSNSTTAPASRERVNALEAQLLLERERTLGRLLVLLPKVSGWGDTAAARHLIRNLYYDIHMYETAAGKTVDFTAWREAQSVILETDTAIRTRISDAQMEALLSAVRHDTVTAEQLGAIVLIQKITSLALAHSPLVKERVRGLINYLEQDDTTFTEYLASEEYKTNHYERFQNRKDSPGYCFVG